MSQAAPAITRSPAEIVQVSPVSQAANGICYAHAGEVNVAENDLDRMIAAVPSPIAASLTRKAYYFVPLTINQGDETVIADRYDVALSDSAVCHRNLNIGDAQCVFISTRLMDDKFSIAFEFYINVGHAMVERAGVSAAFAELAWQQVESMDPTDAVSTNQIERILQGQPDVNMPQFLTKMREERKAEQKAKKRAE